jgi:DNA-directed RNA polymerase sigma subunit (sigma70/sigma32)
VFQTLLAADRDLVRRYYGLDDDRPETLAQLAAAARQDKTRVRERIVQGVARLLKLRVSVELSARQSGQAGALQRAAPEGLEIPRSA